jgi:hypothetical protein
MPSCRYLHTYQQAGTGTEAVCAHACSCAQIHGSYYSLARGSVTDALVDLTGGVGFKVKVDSTAGAAAAADGSLWEDILSWLAGGCIVACRCSTLRGGRGRGRGCVGSPGGARGLTEG